MSIKNALVFRKFVLKKDSRYTSVYRLSLHQLLLYMFYAFVFTLTFFPENDTRILAFPRYHTDIISSIPGFPVGSDFVLIIHQCNQSQHQPMIKSLCSRIIKADRLIHILANCFLQFLLRSFQISCYKKKTIYIGWIFRQ